MLTAGSLFTGIGGLDLGLERAGIKIKWQCEKDYFCRQVLNSRWPTVPIFTDVKYIKRNGFLEKISLLVGGFPCQPVSLAGVRNGIRDYRWLWPDFKKAIHSLTPRYILIENVEGLRTNGLSGILSDLASLGYDAEWDCLPAAIVGAPHIRKRYFIVGYPVGTVQNEKPAIINFDAFKKWAFTHFVTNSTFQRLPQGGTHRLPLSRKYATNTDSPVRGFGWWTVEPNVARMVHGVPTRLDRHKALGNAVVPQLAEFIGHSLIQFDAKISGRTKVLGVG